MDVKDFKKENIEVKIEGDSEIVVEGKETEKSEGSSRCHTFCRRFKFPGLQKDEINAVLSSDGIFTINVPVKVSEFIIKTVF